MKNELNALIMEAMKNHDSVRTESLRAIKSAFLIWQTSKENAGKELTEADEIQLIKKMVKQRQESVEQYIAAGRQELADAEQAQINVLETFLPKAASEEDIVRAFNAAKEANGWDAEKKNMGLFVKAIKASLPNADGKLVAQVVQGQLA
ncbi:MAG: GatB/YqeY domain-containing protein [Paludibacteraceae bacterium]|nr:GatB/YqeY domain-containing protein [Paludibacteraceae bacterium]